MISQRLLNSRRLAAVVAVSVLLSQVSFSQACPDFTSELLAETACLGTYTAYPVNGTQKPYTCSTCGSGLICPGGNCPLISASSEEFKNSECPLKYSSATNDFSCAALQKHCEDMGEGYLMYAKVYFGLPASRFSCSNCTGFFNVEIDDSLEAITEDREVNASFYSPFLLGLFGAGFVMLIVGLVIEYKGKKTQNEDKSGRSVGFDIVDWELKRFFGHVDSHERPRTLTHIIYQEAVLLRYIWEFCCCCLRKKKEKEEEPAEPLNDWDEREAAEDRLFDTTFLLVSVLMSLGIAYLLNGLAPVQIQCELSYPSQAFVIGVADSSRLDPFIGLTPLLNPLNTTSTFPRVIEQQRHLMTLFEQIEAEENVIGTALTLDILTEEVILIGFLVGLEKFLRGCEEMKHWSMAFLGKIHIAVRVVCFLYAAGAVGTQVIKMDVPVVDGMWMVGSNFVFVLVVLTVFLPAIGAARWIAGSCVLSCLGKSVPGATCCGSSDDMPTKEFSNKEQVLPYAPAAQRMDSGKVSL